MTSLNSLKRNGSESAIWHSIIIKEFVLTKQVARKLYVSIVRRRDTMQTSVLTMIESRKHLTRGMAKICQRLNATSAKSLVTMQ